MYRPAHGQGPYMGKVMAFPGSKWASSLLALLMITQDHESGSQRCQLRA